MSNNKYVMSIWIFGDSYADPFKCVPNLDKWTEKIAIEMNLPTFNFGKCGSSLVYTYTKFYEVKDNIQSDDILIISLTDLDRHWFFGDRPELGTQRELTKDQGLSEENTALKYYTLYLDNKLHQIPSLYNFLCAVELLTIQKKLHTIILPNFSDVREYFDTTEDKFTCLNIAKGKMLDISIIETKRENIDKFIKDGINLLGSFDYRINHMCKTNHQILVEKLKKNIFDKTEIDLTSGFVENIYDHYQNNSYQLFKV